MRLPAIFGGVLLSVAATFAVAQPAIVLDYETFTLDNGLQVILVEDHTAPVVAVNVWYHVGGAHDPANRSGFAHLFEHMMFQGTANLDKDALLRLVDDAGGNYNASTARDHTSYHEVLPAHELPLGLWLEADRMASLAVTQTNLDNQRAVVIQEYQQRYGGAPYGLALRDFYSRTYSYDPYRRPSIGNVDDLNQATVDEIRAFHSTYYVPNNATLVVAGDFDPAEARALVETYFGPIPAGDTLPALPEWTPVQQAEAEVTTYQDALIRIPATLIGYETTLPGTADAAALDVLSAILSTGSSSILARDFIDTGVALVADAFHEENRGPGLFGVFLLPGSATRDEVEALFQAVLDDILANGIDQSEIDRAVALRRSQRIASLETVRGIAAAVQQGNAYVGDPAAVATELDRLAAVTASDLQRVIAEYLAPEDRNIYRVDPGQPEPREEPVPFVGATGTPADDAFEVDFALPFAEPPEPLAVTAITFPPITMTTLENGLDVIVIEMPELPVVVSHLVFRGGRAAVAEGIPAIATATADLWTRGTEERSAQEIAGILESRGGVTGAYAQNDIIGLGLFSLIEERETAFDLLAEMALHPAFPEDELAIHLGRVAGGLESALADPSDQVGRAFYPAVYGDHPYGWITTLADLEGVTREAVMAYYESVARPDNGLLIVVGRITADEAMALIEPRFGDWVVEGDPPAPAFPEATSDQPLPIILVDLPAAQQAEIIVGNLATNGNDPDRYALSVLNAVLGQGLSSRLSRILREERGISYSIRSRLSFPIDVGTFLVSSSVQATAVAEAVSTIIAEIERVRTEPIDAAELAAVRDGMIGRFALNLETYSDFIGTVASYWIRSLSLDTIAAYPELVAAVTPESALAAAARVLPENLAVVVAGNAEILAPLLETLGPVTIVEPR